MVTAIFAETISRPLDHHTVKGLGMSPTRPVAPPMRLTAFQWDRMHSVPASQGRLQDIELARVSQEVWERYVLE